MEGSSYQSEKDELAKTYPWANPEHERERWHTQEEKLLAQQELMAAQRENGCWLGGLGVCHSWSKCHSSPALLQLNTPRGGSGNFAALLSAGKLALDGNRSSSLSKVCSLHGVRGEQGKHASITDESTLWSVSSRDRQVTLYWAVGGWSSIQQLVINYFSSSKSSQARRWEFKQSPRKRLVTAAKKMSHLLQRHKHK